MEIKTTHEIWKKHYHNDSEPEGEIPCSKKWVAVDDLIKWSMEYNCPHNNNEIKDFCNCCDGVSQLRKELTGVQPKKQ